MGAEAVVRGEPVLGAEASPFAEAASGPEAVANAEDMARAPKRRGGKPRGKAGWGKSQEKRREAKDCGFARKHIELSSPNTSNSQIQTHKLSRQNESNSKIQSVKISTPSASNSQIPTYQASIRGRGMRMCLFSLSAVTKYVRT